jgi:hypothetical protein
MTNLSPAPGTPQTGTKAVWAGIASVALSFLFLLWATVQGRTDIDTMKATDWLIVIVGALVTALGGGSAAYAAKNRPTG